MGTVINYAGLVNLSIRVGDRDISIPTHNMGLPRLFNAICKALSGEDISDDRPHYVDIEYRQVTQGMDANEGWQSALNRPIPINAVNHGVDETRDNNIVVIFIASVRHNNFIYDITEADRDGTSGKEFRVCLLDKFNNALAYLLLDATAISYISMGTQATIEWTMLFTNKE